ncbi:MAG: aliphatic sulfonate ABC transporter substrate-binding protein [Nostoc sp. LLA-1]|nr:aliphatic sulfonate ABC transporter substrate-binding protein [Cyanocohniella sp. LLY]
MADFKEQFASWTRRGITRRYAMLAFGYGLVLSTTLFSCSSSPDNSQQQTGSSASNVASSNAPNKVIRIVRSKQLTSLAVLEQKGILAERLAPLGYSVEWPEFAAGPQQLEALNAGALDIASTAESPPIFSQAAGAPLVYLAANSSDGQAVSLLVPQNSPIQSIKELKGKKVAFQKASIGHYLIVRALEREGLQLSDIESVALAPPDANVAFSQRKVDAWFIWEPFVTRNVQNGTGRVLTDGGNGLRDTNNFISTNRKFYEENREVIKVFLEELQKANNWAINNPKEIAQLLSATTQLEPPILEIMHDKYDFTLVPITEAIINKQQEVAEKWYGLGLIPKEVNVRDSFLTPEQYAEITPQEVRAKN